MAVGAYFKRLRPGVRPRYGHRLGPAGGRREGQLDGLTHHCGWVFDLSPDAGQ
jgi:hypothetical protein